MAKATAICTCKHCNKTFEVTRDVFSARERESAIAYMTENYTECPACRKARKDAEKAAEAANNGWAQLTGSEKQIAWASDIRRDFITAKIMPMVNPEHMEQARRAVVALTERHTDARWWIDNRSNDNAIFAELAAAAND